MPARLWRHSAPCSRSCSRSWSSGVWQEYDNSAQVVQTEADAISNLYHEVSVLSRNRCATRRMRRSNATSTSSSTKSGRRCAMGESEEAHKSALRIFSLIESYDPKTMGQQTAQADALSHAHAMMDARGNRLFQNQQTGSPLLLGDDDASLPSSRSVRRTSFTYRTRARISL